MSSSNPWSVLLVPPQGSLNRRKVKEGEPFDVFWVLDSLGNKGLLFDVDDSVDEKKLLKASLKLKGIAFSLLDEGRKMLFIKLVEINYQDIFEKLCCDLIEVIYSCKQYGNIFPKISSRLMSWKKLLANSGGGLLSEIEKQGLYAELCFLLEMLKKESCNYISVINSWCGPEKSQHDFVLGEKAIEIKSITNSSRNKITISSEDQLYTLLDELYLSVYFLVVHGSGKLGESLNEVVSKIYSELPCVESIAIFEGKLLEAKYIRIPDNDRPLFSVKEVTNYDVVENFPRIIPSSLSNGVGSVKYKIDVSSIGKYKSIKEIL
jgi:hypothetical protein